VAEHTTDETVMARIQRLVKEEEDLFGRAMREDHDQARLEEIRVELDQYWDLLRQRRALREFGDDPDRAKIRPKSVVEGYEQ
jgi:hypothetical protein